MKMWPASGCIIPWWGLPQAVCDYIMILSPERIILGGGVMHQPQMLPLVRREVHRQLHGYLQGKGLQSDAAYIEHSMESFNQQADRLRTAMAEVAASISIKFSGPRRSISSCAGLSHVFRQRQYVLSRKKPDYRLAKMST